MSQPFVISVILNTDRREDTLECLASLEQNTYKNHRAIVLDNRSTDGSVQAIRTNFPEVQIIVLNDNLGYAGNNNVGIKVALEQGADWVWVLNEDTVIDEECLAKLIDVGRSDPKIGIIGPMVYHHDEPNIIQSGGGKMSRYWQGYHIATNEPDHGQLNEPHEVDWIVGCAILLRRAVIEEVGMLDARFFYFWEETEWCMRAKKAGWRIIHVPQAKLWHKGVQRNYSPKPSVTYYSTRNHLLLLAKHKAPTLARAVAWFQMVRTLASWTVKPKWRSMHLHRNAMWRGAMDFLHHRWGQM